MITKRSVIVEIILVIGLLGACVYGFLWMKQQVKPAVSSALFNVVPQDALVVQRFKSFDALCATYMSEESILSRFCATENGLSFFLKERYLSEKDDYFFSKLSRSEALFSVHYTGKNNLHTLLGINYTSNPEGESAFERLCKDMDDVTLYKRYNKVDVYQFFKDPLPLYIAFSNGFLLAGTSPVVVESSIRHLMSGRSLLDNHVFESLVSISSPTLESSVFVNMRQIDKLLGSLLSKKMVHYNDFLSKCASWIALDGSVIGEVVHLSGHLFLDKGDADFFSTMINQMPAPVKIWEVVPSSTIALISFSLSDFEQYRNRYNNYLEIHKRDKRSMNQINTWEAKTEINLNDWFQMLNPVEIAIAWIPGKSKNQWITFVRSRQIQQVRKSLNYPAVENKQLPQVLPNPASGAFSTFFGPFFGKCTESHYAIIENTLFFGEKELLEAFISEYDKSTSLYGLMKQGRFKGKWMEESGITCVLQGAQAKDSVIGMLDSRFAPLIAEVLDQNDYSLALFQLTPLGGRISANFLLSSDNYKQGSALSRPISGDAVDVEPLPVNYGSFRVFNHATRKYEELVLMSDGTLVFKDAYGKQNWRSRKKYSIVDQVVQIDFYQNDKLQMLYASEGNVLYLLDVLGRVVPGFPVTLSQPVRKGPFLFERSSKKEYEIFMIHTDNSLRLYDKTGNESEGFKPFVPEDRIEQKPVLLNHATKHFWLVYGSQKDYLLNQDGSIAVVFQKRNRIKQDQEVTIDEAGIFHGVTTEGRIVSVQLSTGTIKTRKL